MSGPGAYTYPAHESMQPLAYRRLSDKPEDHGMCPKDDNVICGTWMIAFGGFDWSALVGVWRSLFRLSWM